MKRRVLVFAAAALALTAAVGAWRFGGFHENDPPPGFALANGRIEAKRIDIAAKYPGRVLDVSVDEGDWAEAGQLLARIDASETEAQLLEAEASHRRALVDTAAAEAELARRRAEETFAAQERVRAERLNAAGHAPQEVVDQRTSAHDVAQAGVSAASASVEAAQAGVEAAAARVTRLKAALEDYALHAPKRGRVQYRLAEPGEVVAGGGRVVTMLDLADVYMTVFLPTGAAGRLRIGDEARIILDAAPEYAIPASVSFVASEAQFTPRYVETQSEREKLMFEVRLRIAPDLLRRYSDVVKTGVPGFAYVRVDSGAEWPERLAPRLPDPVVSENPDA